MVLTMLAHDDSSLVAAVDEHSVAKLGSTVATSGQHAMSAAQEPAGAAPSPLLDVTPELELPPPEPHGDAQLCDSQVKTGPSQVEHAPVMQAWSWGTHIASRHVTHVVE